MEFIYLILGVLRQENVGANHQHVFHPYSRKPTPQVQEQEQVPPQQSVGSNEAQSQHQLVTFAQGNQMGARQIESNPEGQEADFPEEKKPR